MRPTFLAGAAVAAILTSGLAATSAAAGPTASAEAAAAVRQGCQDVTVVGHRGIGGPHENTVKGWNLAARGGADVVEGDVWLTEDRVPVIIHDPTWNRTTNWKGRVDQTPYSVVRKRIRTDGGDRIPTLTRALRWSAEHDVGLMLDVKWAPSWDSVARKVDHLGIGDQVTFYARPHHATGGLGAIDRARAAGLLTGVKAWYGRWPMTPEAIGMHGDYVVVGHERADNRPYVERVHAAGVQVYPKGSTRTSWPGLLKAGVDGLTVPNPGRYRQWCEGRTP